MPTHAAHGSQQAVGGLHHTGRVAAVEDGGGVQVAADDHAALHTLQRGGQIHRLAKMVDLGAGLQHGVEVIDARAAIVQHHAEGLILHGFDDAPHVRC